MEVIVEKVFKQRQEVKISFASDRDTWKCIPFSMILSRANPLLGPWVPGQSGDTQQRQSDLFRQAQQSEPDKSLLIERMQESKSVVVLDDDDKIVKERSRSRSPRG